MVVNIYLSNYHKLHILHSRKDVSVLNHLSMLGVANNGKLARS